MRFFNRLQVVLSSPFDDEAAYYLCKEILTALKAGYVLSDDELRLWNQLGFGLGGI